VLRSTVAFHATRYGAPRRGTCGWSPRG
jgi:hypothetical protein